MSGIVVRRALKRETSEVEQIVITAYQDFRNKVPTEILDAYFADLRNLREQWDEAEVIVAETARRLVGSIMFYADASTEGSGPPGQWVGFRKLAVVPGKRGQGIG